MGKPVVKKCPMCGKLYKLGYNGVKGQCDTCAGNERDAEGKFWPPGVSEATYVPVGESFDKAFVEKRPQTFKR
jgi:hypothetical protein